MSADIALIKSRIDIYDLISSYVALRRSGRNFVGCCPFHQEKTPSFTVFTDSQSYKCFGCQKSGDIFTFLMDHESITFPESIEQLASQAGVKIEKNPKYQAQASKEKTWKRLLNTAGHFFCHQFKGPDGVAARQYLHERGFESATLEAFSVGYAPDGFDNFLAHARAKGFHDHDLLTMGLAKKGRNGHLYDFFRNRVIFPVRNPQGQVVAFGGRVLDGSEPKYLNSPETPLFNKRKLLFNFPQARQQFREHGFFMMMEGYTDVMMAFQHGVGPSVATLGTAMTEEHIRILKRFDAPLYLVYDADRAGQNAMDRALPMILNVGLETRVIHLEEGDDPCDLLRRTDNPNQTWKALIDNSSDIFEHKLQHLMATQGTESNEKKLAIAHTMLRDLRLNRDPLRASLYTDTIAKALGIQPELLGQVSQKEQLRPPEERLPKPKVASYTKDHAFFLLSICLRERGYRTHIDELAHPPFDGTPCSSTLKAYLDAHEDASDEQAHHLILSKLSELQQQIFQDALTQELPPQKQLPSLFEEKLKDWVRSAEDPRLLSRQLKEAEASGDVQRQTELLQRIATSRRRQ